MLEDLLVLKNKTLAVISEAANRSDVPEVKRLSLRLARIDDLEKKAAHVAEKLAILKAEAGESPQGDMPSLRVITIRITGRMLRTDMLNVTPYTGQIEAGEVLRITAPIRPLSALGTFETDFVKSNNRLRARREIRAFYRVRQVNEGDEVVLFETAPGEWSLDTKTEYEKVSRPVAHVENAPTAPEEPAKVNAPAPARPKPVQARGNMPEV